MFRIKNINDIIPITIIGINIINVISVITPTINNTIDNNSMQYIIISKTEVYLMFIILLYYLST